jgi:hypothetical protein
LAVRNRENDIQAAERLTAVVTQLAALGSEEQRRRSRIGQFVSKPAAIEAQVDLESALRSVAKRIKAREDHQ